MAAVSFDSATGSVSYREVRDDGVVDEGSVSFWFRRNGFMRIDGENGIQMLEAPGTTLVRDHLGKMQQLDGVVSWAGHGNPRQLLGGHDAGRNLSNPNDYSAPVGAPEPAGIDGRPGWRFTLAPPEHQQFPLEVVIDDETAAILEMRSVGTTVPDPTTNKCLSIASDTSLSRHSSNDHNATRRVPHCGA